MHCLQLLVTLAALVAIALGHNCTHDNCFKAVARFEGETSPPFCSQYLARPYYFLPRPPGLSETPSATVNSTTTPKPHALAGKCSPRVNSPPQTNPLQKTNLTYSQDIHSACHCLTATANTTTSTQIPTSTLSTSTCARSSAAACPTPYTPCCAYLCAEAQVPFLVCSQQNETVLAQCQKCPAPTDISVPDNTPIPTISISTPIPVTTPIPTPTTIPSKTTASTTGTTASTCSRASAAACPTPKDRCCNYLCSVAQVPFEICSETDTSGQFEVCRKCEG